MKQIMWLPLSLSSITYVGINAASAETCVDIDHSQLAQGKNAGQNPMAAVAIYASPTNVTSFNGRLTWLYGKSMPVTNVETKRFKEKGKRQYHYSNSIFDLYLNKQKVLSPSSFTPCQEDEDDCVQVPGRGFGTVTGGAYFARLIVAEASGRRPLVFNMACER